MNEQAFAIYQDNVRYYYDSFFKYRHKRFIKSTQFDKWCYRLAFKNEPKETAEIIIRAFYLYKLYERF